MRASGTDMPAMVRRLFQHWNLQRALLRDRIQEVGRARIQGKNCSCPCTRHSLAFEEDHAFPLLLDTSLRDFNLTVGFCLLDLHRMNTQITTSKEE